MNSPVSTDDVPADTDPVQQEAYDWIVRFARGDMTAAELDRMKRWYEQSPAHAAAYGEARRLWRTIGPVAGERMRRDSESLEQRTSAGAPHRIARRAMLGGALAASAAFLAVRPPLGLWPSYAELAADYRTAVGEQRQVALDAVSLDMNTRTSVTVLARTPGDMRLDLVSGEVLIGARALASPLTIEVGSGRVITADGAFNVKRDESRVVVTCLAGSLQVEQRTSTTALAARQQLGLQDGAIGAVTTVDPDVVTAWRDGVLVFDFAPVATVIDEVNRYRANRIVLLNQAIGSRLLSARLRIDETDRIVTQIVHIFGAKATRVPGGFVVLT